jgi:hypothetical protein
VRRRPSHRRRPRIGLPGRAASWLLAFTLLVQCAVSGGAALGMWIEAHGPGQMAQGHCAEHGPSGKQDQSSGHASHDHEHCLLCNAAVGGDCPAPVLPLLSAAFEESVVPAAAPEVVAYRKVAYAHAPRGPPPPT